MRTGRLRVGAVFVTAALLLMIAPVAEEAFAAHGALRLEVTPEVASRAADTGHVVTASLRNAMTGQPSAAAADVAIDFEVESGPNNPEGNTPETPDATCTIVAGASSCTRTFTSSAPGTNFIRVWVDEDGQDESGGGGTESDRTEGRMAGVTTDCLPDEVDPCSGPTPDQPQAGSVAERDITDVVQVTWTASADTLDCDDANGNDSDTNPNTGTASAERYTCTVVDQFGNPVNGVRIDGENRSSGVNDPDDADGGSADFNDLCTTSGNGTCSGNVAASEAQTGVATICFWADTDNDSVYDLPGAEADGGACDEEAFDAPESDNQTDVVRKRWATLQNQQIIPEGATHSGFTTFLSIANSSSDVTATVNVTYLTSGGPVEPAGSQERDIGPGKRISLNVNQQLGTASDSGARVAAFGAPVVAELSMHRSGSLAVLDMISAGGPSSTWLMPEGATHSGFGTFVTIANPDTATDTHVNVRFLTGAGVKAGSQNLLVPKGGRRTISVNLASPDGCGCSDDVSTEVTVVGSEPQVVAGVSVHKQEAGDLAIGGSVGVTATRTHWVVAEGATHSNWSTFVLVANPAGSTATVQPTYLTPGGTITGEPLAIPPTSRRTIAVNAPSPAGCGCSSDVSTQIVAVTGTVAVESSIQKNDSNGFVIADSVGSGGTSAADASGTSWLSAEGVTHSGFQTFILIANPGSTAADVQLTFLTPDGQVAGPGLPVPAGERRTVYVNQYVPNSEVSTKVVANSGKVVVELAVDRISSGFSKGRSLAFRLAP